LALHFVWFRGDEYNRAIAVFGKPDFIHRGWDRRAQREIADDDVVIFARGEHDQHIHPYNFQDINE
jgi:hypothetical protein